MPLPAESASAGRDGGTSGSTVFAEGYSEQELLSDETPSFWAPIVAPLAAIVGGDPTDSFVRVMVLRTMCRNTEKVYWTRDEILAALPFIVPRRIYSALTRLRHYGLMRTAATLEHLRKIEITAAGRAALASLEVLKDFGNDEELRFGYVVTQLAGSVAAGTVSPEVIDVCLSTINSLIARADEALGMRSERLIEEAHEELQRQWRWLEQAGQILERLADDVNMSSTVHRKAQRTGKVLSSAQKLDSLLKRHGAEIAHQRERMTKSGLTGRMVADWLRTLSVDALCEFAANNVRSIPRPILLNSFSALDVAHETLDRGRLAAIVAPPLPSLGKERGKSGHEIEIDNSDFHQFVTQLRSVNGRQSLPTLVLVPGDFPRTALRLGTLIRAEASTFSHSKEARESTFEGLDVELHLADEALPLQDSAVSRIAGGEVSIRSEKRGTT